MIFDQTAYIGIISFQKRDEIEQANHSKEATSKSIMSKDQLADISRKASRVTELLEEIMSLDELLLIHQAHHASQAESKQYEERKTQFLIELNSLLRPHRLNVSVGEQVA
ncbi:MAG: hypothetical protein AB8F95_13735 [Bacteroidia bacterium]